MATIFGKGFQFEMRVGLSSADHGDEFCYVRDCEYPGCQRLVAFFRREGEQVTPKPAVSSSRVLLASLLEKNNLWLPR